MRKKLMIMAAALTLAGGAATVALAPSSVSAQSASSDVPEAGRQGPLARALASLVEDQTLTRAQADAVVERVRAEVPDRPGRGRGQGQGNRRARLREAAGVAADTIGITTGELRTAVRGGQTIAEVAHDNDVEPQAVIDALVEHATARIDRAAADDRIDEARADEIKARLPDLADRFVNHGPRSR